MKKIFLSSVLIIILIIAGGIFYVLNNLDELVRTAIETHGSDATQTAVHVDSVNINLTNGTGGISGLTIANPSGYTIPNAFSLAEIRIGIDLQSVQEEPYIINEIVILAPQVFVEINEGNKTNLNELKKNIATASSATAQDKTAQEPAQGKIKEPRLIIRRVTFADGTIQARVAALQNKEYQLKLPALDMTNLGGGKGATATELASEILERLTDRASDIVKKEIIDAELNKLKDKAQVKIDEEKAKLKAQADTIQEEEKQKAQDKLKNIFTK